MYDTAPLDLKLNKVTIPKALQSWKCRFWGGGTIYIYIYIYIITCEVREKPRCCRYFVGLTPEKKPTFFVPLGRSWIPGDVVKGAGNLTKGGKVGIYATLLQVPWRLNGDLMQGEARSHIHPKPYRRCSHKFEVHLAIAIHTVCYAFGDVGRMAEWRDLLLNSIPPILNTKKNWHETLRKPWT